MVMFELVRILFTQTLSFRKGHPSDFSSKDSFSIRLQGVLQGGDWDGGGGQFCTAYS